MAAIDISVGPLAEADHRSQLRRAVIRASSARPSSGTISGSIVSSSGWSSASCSSPNPIRRSACWKRPPIPRLRRPPGGGGDLWSLRRSRRSPGGADRDGAVGGDRIGLRHRRVCCILCGRQHTRHPSAVRFTQIATSHKSEPSHLFPFARRLVTSRVQRCLGRSGGHTHWEKTR
jgi:hypothetical protein